MSWSFDERLHVIGQIVNIMRVMGSCKHDMFFKCITISKYHSCCGHFMRYKGRSLIKKNQNLGGARNLLALRGKRNTLLDLSFVEWSLSTWSWMSDFGTFIPLRDNMNWSWVHLSMMFVCSSPFYMISFNLRGWIMFTKLGNA